jgi:hypothetical protein
VESVKADFPEADAHWEEWLPEGEAFDTHYLAEKPLSSSTRGLAEHPRAVRKSGVR